MRYGKDTDRSRDLSYVFELEMDGLNNGAMIQFLSQYPAEAEVLLGPMTGLEITQEGRIEGTIRHFKMRPTVNQRAVRIEEVVEQRKTLHVSTLCNLRATPITLRLCMQTVLTSHKTPELGILIQYTNAYTRPN